MQEKKEELKKKRLEKKVFDFSFLNHLLHHREAMTIQNFIETIAAHGIENKKQIKQLSLFIFLDCISTTEGDQWMVHHIEYRGDKRITDKQEQEFNINMITEGLQSFKAEDSFDDSDYFADCYDAFSDRE